MSKTPKNKKYLELDNVRVYYNQSEDSIQLITKDPDLKGKQFQLTLKNGTESEQNLRNLLREKDVITERGQRSGLPKFIHYPTVDNYSFDKIPESLNNKDNALVGETYENTTYAIDLRSSSRIIIRSKAGDGKSILVQNFVLHALRYKDDFSIISIDPKYTMSFLRHSKPKNLVGISSTPEDVLTTLKFAKAVMEKRYEAMVQQGFSNFEDFENSSEFIVPKIMIVISNLDEILRKPLNYPREEQANREVWYKETVSLLQDILNNNYDTGIVVVASSSYTEIPEEINESFDTRVNFGSSSHLKGKALISFENEKTDVFQIYYSHDETLYEVIEGQFNS